MNSFFKKVIKVKPSCCYSCGKKTRQIGNRFVKYCDLKCKREYESKVEKKHFNNKSCDICGNIFTPLHSRNRYCSDKCKVKADTQARSKKPKFKKCNFCGNQFEPYSSLDKFCSALCRIKNVKSKRSRNWTDEKAKLRTGKNNPNYTHGMCAVGVKKDSSGLRLFFKNRDSYRQDIVDKHGYLFCEKCGKTNCRFEAHHIIFRSEKPKHEFLHDKRNIINLCHVCHSYYHSRKANRNELVVSRGLHELFGNDVLNK